MINNTIVNTIMNELERLNLYPNYERSFPFLTRYKGEISAAVHVVEITSPRGKAKYALRGKTEEYMTIYFDCTTGLAKAYECGIQKTNENYITVYCEDAMERYLTVFEDILTEYAKEQKISVDKYAMNIAEIVDNELLMNMVELVGRSLYQKEIWKCIMEKTMRSTKTESGKIEKVSEGEEAEETESEEMEEIEETELEEIEDEI